MTLPDHIRNNIGKLPSKYPDMGLYNFFLEAHIAYLEENEMKLNAACRHLLRTGLRGNLIRQFLSMWKVSSENPNKGK